MRELFGFMKAARKEAKNKLLGLFSMSQENSDELLGISMAEEIDICQGSSSGTILRASKGTAGGRAQETVPLPSVAQAKIRTRSGLDAGLLR